MTRIAIGCGILFATLSLGGCVALGGPDPVKIVAPAPIVPADPAWPAVDWSLLVQRPVADQTRGSVRIVVRTANSQLAFYPGLAWLDELPEMLQTELLRAFADSGRIPAVARPGVARASYALATEIRRFDAIEESRGQLVVEIELQAALLEVRTGEQQASRVFSHRVPVAGGGVEALTGAFEDALGALIGEMIGWTLAVAPDRKSKTNEDSGR